MHVIWKHTLLSLYFRERRKLENSSGAFDNLSPELTHVFLSGSGRHVDLPSSKGNREGEQREMGERYYTCYIVL